MEYRSEHEAINEARKYVANMQRDLAELDKVLADENNEMLAYQAELIADRVDAMYGVVNYMAYSINRDIEENNRGYGRGIQ